MSCTTDHFSDTIRSYHPLILTISQRVMRTTVPRRFIGQVTYADLYVAGQYGVWLALRRIASGVVVLSPKAYIGTAARAAMCDWLRAAGWLRTRGATRVQADVNTGHLYFVNVPSRDGWIERVENQLDGNGLPDDADWSTPQDRQQAARWKWKNSDAGRAANRRSKEAARRRAGQVPRSEYLATLANRVALTG